MKKYNFTRLDAKHTPNTNKITLNESQINIGKEAFKNINLPQRIDIYYDIQNKAIKLIENENGRKITQNNGYYQLTTTLSRIMPKGRYYFNDGVFIFEQVEDPEPKQRAEKTDL